MKQTLLSYFSLTLRAHYAFMTKKVTKTIESRYNELKSNIHLCVDRPPLFYLLSKISTKLACKSHIFEIKNLENKYLYLTISSVMQSLSQ